MNNDDVKSLLFHSHRKNNTNDDDLDQSESFTTTTTPQRHHGVAPEVNNSGDNINIKKSSKMVTTVSLQDYLERPSPQSNVVAINEVSGTKSSSSSCQPITTTTKTTTTTTDSVTSFTMDNTSWNDESCSSCLGTGPVL
jgi:hypothetical protein